MDKKSYSIRLASWAGIINEANNSGMPKTTWCKQNGIRYRQFNYWQKKIRDFVLEHPDTPITNLPLEQQSLPEKPSELQFFEMTFPQDELSRPTHDNAEAIPTPPDPDPIAQMPTPHLMLKLDKFQLYIGDGCSKRDLYTMIKALRDA